MVSAVVTICGPAAPILAESHPQVHLSRPPVPVRPQEKRPGAAMVPPVNQSRSN